MTPDDEQMQDLFGSDSDEDDGPKRPAFAKTDKSRLKQQTKASEDGDDAAVQDELEDDLGDDEAAAPAAQEGAEVGAYGSDDEEERHRMRSKDRRAAAAARNGPPMTIEAPLLPVPPSHNLHRLKLSNIVGLEPMPFDPETYVEEEEVVIDAEGKRRVKLKDMAVIRWRCAKGPDGKVLIGPDGQPVKESNARFVRWSDGSLQLLLGEEVLDVVITEDHGKNEFLFCISGVIQGQAPLTSRLGFRPATYNSKLHKRLREEVDKRTAKMQKTAVTADLYDPAKVKADKEKVIEERMALQGRQDKSMKRAAGAGGGRPRGRQQLNTRFLEEEGDGDFIDDEGEGDEGAGAGPSRRHLDEDEEEEAARRLQSAKRDRPPPAARGGRDAGRGRGRGKAESEEEEDDEDDGDEPEYEESEEAGSSDDEGAGGAGRGSGSDDGGDDDDRGRAGGSKKGAPTANAAGAATAANKGKARRGVVLSDDEDD